MILENGIKYLGDALLKLPKTIENLILNLGYSFYLKFVFSSE